MQTEDLRTYSAFGKVLWSDPEFSQRVSLETLSAVSLLKLNGERTLERASVALLERAKNRAMSTGGMGNADLLNQSFYRLSVEERFVLVALHIGKWSYARLARVLGLSRSPLPGAPPVRVLLPKVGLESETAIPRAEVEALAWRARLQMNTSSNGKPGVYPAGPGQPGPICPGYDSERPWTQRFLDDEISSPRDRIFIQNHLMGCSSCYQALGRCRDFYYRVDQEIAALKLGSDLDEGVEALRRALEQNPYWRFSSERSFRDSLRVFVRRWDILFALGLGVLLVFFRVFFH